MSSIRHKIQQGAYIYLVLALLFAVLAYSDLKQLTWQVKSGVTVYDFIDAVRDSRRHEKNLFLYHEQQEWQAAVEYLQRAQALLAEHPEAFHLLQSYSDVDGLEKQLRDYHAQLSAYGGNGKGAGDEVSGQQSRIRALGHQLQEQMKSLQLAERSALEKALQNSLLSLLSGGLLIALVGVVAAWVFARIAVRPLKWLEIQLAAISAGQIQRLQPPSEDQELYSLAAAVAHMKQEIEGRNRQLLQAEKLASLGTLVSGVAHELNNPLSNISSSSQILLDELAAGKQTDPSPWLKQIDDETQRAKGIVTSLLSFARDSAFQLQWWPLEEVIEEAMRLLGQLRREQVEIAITEGLHVRIDQPRILQVLVNLLSNALDAGDEQLRIQIEASVIEAEEIAVSTSAVSGRRRCPPQETGPLLLMQISDNGRGIEPQVLTRIFDPFFTTKDVGQGYGLGLYVCAEIIERHQGCIMVESELGVGTRFTLALPIDGESLV